MTKNNNSERPVKEAASVVVFSLVDDVVSPKYFFKYSSI